MNTVRLRGKMVRVPEHGTKADIARFLLSQDYTVSEISKAVPMAYSQVHSIHKTEQARHESSGAGIARAVADRWPQAEPKPKPMTSSRAKVETQKAQKLVSKYLNGGKPAAPRVGKLRTPGLPNDKAVGECANCGHDLVVRSSGGLMLVHVNITAEEYLHSIQFCQPVPKILLGGR